MVSAHSKSPKSVSGMRVSFLGSGQGAEARAAEEEGCMIRRRGLDWPDGDDAQCIVRQVSGRCVRWVGLVAQLAMLAAGLAGVSLWLLR